MIFLLAAAMLALTVSLESTVAAAETIDPNNDGSQFAWSDNGGWINFEPSLGPGVTVTSPTLTGWISLSCQGTGTCGQVNYGVTNYRSLVPQPYAGRLLSTPLLYHDPTVKDLFGFAAGKIELDGSESK